MPTFVGYMKEKSLSNEWKVLSGWREGVKIRKTKTVIPITTTCATQKAEVNQCSFSSDVDVKIYPIR